MNGAALGPPKEWRSVPYGALSVDEIYAVLCAHAELGSAVSLGLTCRLLCHTLGRLAVAAYASVAPRVLGRRGPAYLLARWARSGVCQEEVNAALLGAAERGHAETINWLARAGGEVPPAFPPPRCDLLGEALAALVRQEITCQTMRALVGACPVAAAKAAFIEACARGKLGLAQVAYHRVLARAATPRAEVVGLLREGVAVVEARGCYRHIAVWVGATLRALEQRR